MNAIFILVIKVYLTSPLGAGIQKYHGASQFQTYFYFCVRPLDGQNVWWAAPRTTKVWPALTVRMYPLCIHFLFVLKILPKPRT